MTADPQRVDTVAGQVPLPGMPLDVVLAAEHVAEPLSADRRRTIRQQALTELGIHPLTGGPTQPRNRCGSCVHRVLVKHHDRTYPKCDLGPATHGAATDVRRWWPACDRFEPGDRISDDAARWTPDHADQAEARP